MKDPRSSICAEVEEILVDILRGAVSAAAIEPHLDHVRSCPHCGAIHAVAMGLAGAPQCEVPDPGPHYWEGFLPRLEQRLRAGPGQRTGWRPNRTAALSMAAALLVAAGWFMVRPWLERTEGERLEARLEAMILQSPDRVEPAETALLEILPDDSDLVGWSVPDPDNDEDGEWFLETVVEDDVYDLAGPADRPEVAMFTELDREGRRELLRQLQEELTEVQKTVPGVGPGAGIRFGKEKTA